MPWQSISLWTLRIAAIGFFTLTHSLLIAMIVTTGVIEIFGQAPNGEEPDLSSKAAQGLLEVWQFLQILSWPILIPLEMFLERLPSSMLRPEVSNVLIPSAIVANSLVWGVAIWIVIEVACRKLLTAHRLLTNKAPF